MKKKTLLLMGIFAIGISIYAQVGINTKNPLGVFHVDPKTNTNATGTSGTNDDVIITADGKVGLGTVEPLKTLDVRGKFKLVDGTQGEGKFLTSDANGFASWEKYMNSKKFIDGKRPSILPLTSSTPIYANTYIELPTGTWMIAYTATYLDYSVSNYIIWHLSTSSTSLIPYSNSIKSKAYSAQAEAQKAISVSCYFLVENSSPSNQTYYLWGQLQNNTTKCSFTGEFAFYAIPLS